MTIWGQLGDIVLEPPIVPVTYNIGTEYGYAEMQRISGLAGLQRVPNRLRKPTLTFQVHWLEQGLLSPQEYLNLFSDAAAAKESLPLTIGGQLVGNFVITNLEVRQQRFTPEGALTEARWNVNLLEFADTPEPQRQRLTGFLQRVRTA